MQLFTTIKNHKFFFVFVAIYCAILVAFSRYAPNVDDLSWFESIILNDAGFFHYGGGNPHRGRFYPFAFIDLLILMQISKSPYLFFAFNALLFALFSALYLKILNLSLGKRALNALITVLLSLSVGFVIVFFGICYPEKIQVIWIAIFMLCTFFVLQKPTQTNQLFGIIALNIALYYKEPTFIAAFAFGVVLLLFARQNNRKDLQKYAFYVICSALLYALLYVLLVLVLWNVREYYHHNAIMISDILACVVNDSFIVFACGGILLYRIYCVLIKKERIEPFFDGFLCASFAYFIAFMGLKMYASYYLLPCYVLGIPSVLYFSRKYFCNIFIKIVLFLGLFGFLAQNLPSGIHKTIDLKAQGVQFHQTLDFVASHLEENKDTKIFFEGIGSGKRLYGYDAQIYSFYFVKYAIVLHKIDTNIWILRTNAPYERDEYYDVQSGTPKSGDLIIVSNKSAFGDSLQKAQNRGELIFVSGFPTMPHIALMPFVKYLNAKYFKSEFFGKNSNFFTLPRRTYVVRVH